MEQRSVGLVDPLAALGDHPLREQIQQQLDPLQNVHEPLLSEFTLQTLARPRFQTARFDFAFDSSTGTLVQVLDRITNTTILDPSQDSRIGQLSYMLYGEKNLTDFMLDYSYVSLFFPADDYDDFDKVGIKTVYQTSDGANPNQTLWVRQTKDSQEIYFRVAFSDNLHTEGGAPQFGWVMYSLPAVTSTETKVTVEVRLFNKTATRLPVSDFLQPL